MRISDWSSDVCSSDLVVAAALLIMSWLLFTGEGLLIDVAYPSLGSFAVFALLVFANYLREESRREQVRSAFRHYLSPALVDQLANEPDRLVLGGETREMTMLFSDVRSETRRGGKEGVGRGKTRW